MSEPGPEQAPQPSATGAQPMQPRTPPLASAAPRSYEPPTLTPLGALHEMLLNKTDAEAFDFEDGDPGDPRIKV